MRLKATVDTKIDIKGTTEAITKAGQQAMLGTVVDIWNDSVHDSPWLTGHNRRSLVGEVSGLGIVAQGGDAEPEKVVNDAKLEGAAYSTSGYGGYLETGTVKMSARPYMKPAMDRHFTEDKFEARVRGQLK